MRYSIRALLIAFLFAAIFLSGAVPFVRWFTSRPGREVTEAYGLPIEIGEIKESVGEDSIRDVQIWELYGGWFSCNFIWRANASPEAVDRLRQLARMQKIDQIKVPVEFWKIPADWSETPDWWAPKHANGAEYYMSPTFEPRRTGNDNLDCVAMYDPDRQLLYVLSQWDF